MVCDGYGCDFCGGIKMTRRSGKFYSKNEKEIMRRFGLKPTKASGSGWIEKEDGA